MRFKRISQTRRQTKEEEEKNISYIAEPTQHIKKKKKKQVALPLSNTLLDRHTIMIIRISHAKYVQQQPKQKH